MAIAKAANKFNTAAGPKAPAGRRKASRFSGVSSGGDQDPQPTVSPNKQRLKLITAAEDQVPGKDPYLKCKFEVVESDVSEPGSVVSVIQCTSSAAISAAAPRIKAMVKGLIGDTSKKGDDTAFNTFDPDGDFVELFMGSIDSYVAPENDLGIDAGQEFGPNPLAECMVDVIVSRGKPVKDSETGQPTGEYYNNYAWFAVEG